MKQLLFISLMFAGVWGNAQHIHYPTSWNDTGRAGQVQMAIAGKVGWVDAESVGAITVDSRGRIVEVSKFVMMQIVLLDRPSVHFFRKGYKRGEKYWYFDNKRVKPLPKSWMVWEYKEIKE